MGQMGLRAVTVLEGGKKQTTDRRGFRGLSGRVSGGLFLISILIRFANSERGPLFPAHLVWRHVIAYATQTQATHRDEGFGIEISGVFGVSCFCVS